MHMAMVGHEDSRDKHKWGESNLVYMRKGHAKGAKPNPVFDEARQGQGQAQTQGQQQGPGLRESDNSMGNTVDGNEGAAKAALNGSLSIGRKNDDARKETSTRSGHGVGMDGLSIRDIDAAHVTIKLDGYSKQEIWDLRRKLTQELEQVRGTFKKVEARELRLRGCYGGAGSACHSASQFSGNEVRNNGWKEVASEVASGGAITPKQSLRESKPMPISLVENNQATSDVADKGKRTPKANRYYRNSEFVLGKEKFPPAENKKSKLRGNKKIAQSKPHDLSSQNFPNEVLKQCHLLLIKMMKRKHGWVFNSPVDADSLGLHDYHTIIKNPMDLGTVKSKLEKDMYNSPTSFAEDIRLTLSNAMTYNPEGHDVHILAKQLRQLFEERWKSLYAEHIEGRTNARYGSCSVKKLPLSDIKKNFKKSETAVGSSPSKIRPIKYPANRTPTGKKPKAKDPHKRGMTFDEKQKLSANLQNLPADRMELIVQIIKKRNPSLCQQDEEIEVDIDTFDTETLWELDRFVTNFKKSLSKLKKKELLAQQAKSVDEHGLASGKCLTTGCELPKKNKKGEQGEDKVKIDDNMPSSNCPPVEIEKDGGSESRSSSSGTSSSGSGSSSSDSERSSASESDAFAAHSPISGSKVMPHG